jgi:acyl-CoA thioesterase
MGFQGRNADEVTKFFGVVWDDAETLRLTVKPEYLNPVGFLSGVAAFTLVDYSMASALIEQMTPDERCATLNISIQYLRTARSGDIVCRSVVDRRTRTNAALRSEVVDEAGAVLCTAVGTYAVFTPRPGGPSPG